MNNCDGCLFYRSFGEMIYDAKDKLEKCFRPGVSISDIAETCFNNSNACKYKIVYYNYTLTVSQKDYMLDCDKLGIPFSLEYFLNLKLIELIEKSND